MKIKFTGNIVSNTGTAISVPEGANIEIEASDNYFDRVGEILHVRPNEMARPLKELVAYVQNSGLPPEAVQQAINAVKNAEPNDEARTVAVKRSPAWKIAKDVGPDVVAFVVKSVLAYLGN